MSKSQSHVTWHTENGVIVLTFNDPTLNADAVSKALTVINATDNRKVILDFQSIRFLVGGSLRPDQEPLTPLLKLGKQLTEEGGRLVLCNVGPEVADVLRVTRFDRIVEIQPNVNSALACLDRPTESTTPSYSHTQWAPVCLILYGVAIYSISLGWFIGHTLGMYVAGGVGLLLASLAPCFHHLTVRDQGEVLGIRFGPIPLFRRTVRYADIKTVEVGRTLILDGWGIHLSIRGGWVWNLWGRECVVIHFKKGVLRIGTNDAKNLAGFLKTRIVGGGP